MAEGTAATVGVASAMVWVAMVELVVVVAAMVVAAATHPGAPSVSAFITGGSLVCPEAGVVVPVEIGTVTLIGEEAKTTTAGSLHSHVSTSASLILCMGLLECFHTPACRRRARDKPNDYDGRQSSRDNRGSGRSVAEDRTVDEKRPRHGKEAGSPVLRHQDAFKYRDGPQGDRDRDRDKDRDRDRDRDRNGNSARERNGDRERERRQRDRAGSPDPVEDDLRHKSLRQQESRHSEDQRHGHHGTDRSAMPPPPPPGPPGPPDRPHEGWRQPGPDDGPRGRGHDHGAGPRHGGRGHRGGAGDDGVPRGKGGKEVWGRQEEQGGAPPPAVVVQPVMELSGKLAAETNKVGGVVLKHQPPAEASKPDKKWRLYVFKGEALVDGEPLYLHRNDHYLFGREQKVVDVLCAHPSISKQHAVVQFRLTTKPGPDGLDQSAIRPYLMDLGTVNGTFLNGDQLEAQRYYELLPQDVIRFAQSTREYVLLHEELTGRGK
ncbi:hypothetical protein QJQ45_030085 [Haematococcus lacustris]|nr:hypothetical protein QJQ45_030085 [Haematococcus lacustris]